MKDGEKFKNFSKKEGFKKDNEEILERNSKEEYFLNSVENDYFEMQNIFKKCLNEHNDLTADQIRDLIANIIELKEKCHISILQSEIEGEIKNIFRNKINYFYLNAIGSEKGGIFLETLMDARIDPSLPKEPIELCDEDCYKGMMKKGIKADQEKYLDINNYNSAMKEEVNRSFSERTFSEGRTTIEPELGQ